MTNPPFTPLSARQRIWQRARPVALGPLLATAAIGIIELADSFGIKIPYPPSLMVIIVVFGAFVGGLTGGFATHAIACFYLSLYYSLPVRPFSYGDGDLLRVVGFALTTPILVLMASLAKQRTDRLREASLRQEREHSASLLALLEERRKTEEKLHQAMKAAEAANRAKSEFLANVSHEVRTPMNGIIGLTMLTLESDLTRQQREALEMVKTSADSLLMVINDILDFSKIEAGRMELDNVEIDLWDVVGDATKTLALRAHEKGLELCCRIAPGVPQNVLGDSLRLRQILLNLVSNAIKFTDAGDVLVSVDVQSREADAVNVRFQVHDTGMGIHKDKQRMIFDAFTQADGSANRKYEGTGLGLSISSRLAEQMHGRLQVESEVNKGSTFYFTARLSCPGPQKPEGIISGVPKDARVLVVDDNITSCDILDELLRGWGLEPVVTTSGDAALAAIDSAIQSGQPFSLVLVDSTMPDMDGFALAQAMQEHGSKAAVVMMLTSVGRRGARSSDRALGISAYLTKPIKKRDLLKAIISSLSHGLISDKPVRPSDSEMPRERRRTSLRVLLAEDNLINQRLMVRLLEKPGHEVTLVRTGAAALDAITKASRPFHIVLMDVQMPVMDGFAATAAIRTREQVTGGHLPLVALTAHAMRGDRERCLQAGFDGYVPKPIRFEELFDTIDRLVPDTLEKTPAVVAAPTAVRSQDKVREPRPPTLTTPPLPAEMKSTVAFSEATALESTGGDRALLKELIGVFLNEAPGWMRELEKAVQLKDAGEMQRLAHTIKGAVDSCGAHQAYDAAMLLERMGRGGEFEGAQAQYAALERELARVRPDLVTYIARDREG